MFVVIFFGIMVVIVVVTVTIIVIGVFDNYLRVYCIFNFIVICLCEFYVILYYC
jgi:hypothetical protein